MAGDLQEDSTASQLDSAQVLKASTALLRHMRSEATKGAGKDAKNLFAVDEDEAATPENAEGVWCQINTKKHIVDEKRLKPTKIPIPHTLNLGEATAVCLITPDPQRTFKTVLEHPAFPSSLAQQIRVLGVTKLKQRYRSFESRRQLRAQYDVFLADDRVITMLPRLLGKIFYEHSKRPVPVSLEPPKDKDAGGKYVKRDKAQPTLAAAPAAFAAEIQKALTSARVHLAPSTSTAVQVGWSVFSAHDLAANVEAVVNGMVTQRIIPKGWRNIRAVHIKGPNTAALPIWMSDVLWVDETDVIEDHEAAELAKQRERPAGGKRKKGRGLDVEAQDANDNEEPKRLKAADSEAGFSEELAKRREALRRAKQASRDAAEEREAMAMKKSAAKRAKELHAVATPG